VASEVAIITALNTQIARLGAVVGEHSGRHGDAEIYLSPPGLGVILAAPILGEIGDDPDRYADARSRKNYAGTSRSPKPLAPRRSSWLATRNRRLGDALQQWAFCSLRGSPGAKAQYQQLPDCKIGHEAALRQLANRFVGILHGGLKTTPLRRTRRLGAPLHDRRLASQGLGCLPRSARGHADDQKLSAAPL
jgi:transposase